ncbi:MAG: helix-turn-helix domain-containing protein [bacterium]
MKPESSNAEPLSSLVRRLRTGRGWSQEHLAEASGISLRTVQRIETGLAASPDTLRALAAAFQVDFALLASASTLRTGSDRRFGLTGRQAVWTGLALCAPTALFIAVSVAIYDFGETWLEFLLPAGVFNAVWNHPLILLVPPAAAILLNAPHLFSLRTRLIDEGAWVEGVLIRWNWPQAAAAALALGLIALLLAYFALEILIWLVLEAAAGG